MERIARPRPTGSGATAVSLGVAMTDAGAGGVAIGACGGAATGGDTTTEGCGVGAMGAVCERSKVSGINPVGQPYCTPGYTSPTTPRTVMSSSLAKPPW